MVRFKKQLRRCRRAVSDIIGNLLILAITVTLFSSIMFYVATIPSPEEQTYAEITYDLGEVVSSSRWIYLTHKGGQELINGSTNIYIFKYGSELISLKLADGALSGQDREKWSPGEVWQYELSGVNNDTPLSIMIIDTSQNTKVWEAEMVGGQVTGDYAPVITTRGTLPTIIIDGSTFIFYASVSDFNDDLNTSSVYVDASSLGIAPSLIQLTDSDGDGVFISAPMMGDKDFDNKEVMVKATDLTNKAASTRFTLIAQQDMTGGGGSNETNIGPFTGFEGYLVNGTYPPDASGGQSGDTLGTTFYYIRRASDKNITRDFEPGEKFYIEVYSNKLTNLALENSFSMFNPTTGNLVAPQTKLVNAFQYGGIYATFHRYYINVTAPTQTLFFPLQISLRDNAGAVANIADTISVSGATYPIIKTYRLNETNKLELCNSFNHTDKVYLKIFTKDVDSNITTVVLNDIQINGYSGKYIIKQTLPTPITWTSGVEPNPSLSVRSPLSQLYKTVKTGDSPARQLDNTVLNSVYTVRINLLEPNNDWWLPGRNSYTLLIPVLTDSGNSGTGETYYNMNYQFNVTAPRSTTDLVASVGAGSFTWSASGAAWEDNKLVWYKNGERFDQWDATYIDEDTYNGPTGMVLADIDNDGYQDLVVGYQDSTVSLAWYRNQNIEGSAWSTLPYIICNAFDAYPNQQADMTQHWMVGNDWYGNDNTNLVNEDVTIWSDDRDSFVSRYGSQYFISVNEIVGSVGAGDFDGDGDLDIVASFMHTVVWTTATSPSSANAGNSWGMFFNRGIYVFWNDGGWTRTQLSGTNLYTNNNDNPAALDLAVDDLNQDGVDDIVAVYETGDTRVWVNQWKQIIGTSTNPKVDAFKTYVSLTSVGGNTPWSHKQMSPCVTTADVDLNGYPDIIRTSTTAGVFQTVTVFRTTSTTSSVDIMNPDKQNYTGAEPSALVTGGLADLASDNNVYQVLTEVYKNTSLMYSAPDQKQTVSDADGTGEDITDLALDDGVTYDVDIGELMNVRDFPLNATYSGSPVTHAVLRVKYSTTPDYNGNGPLRYWDGTAYRATTIVPVPSATNVTATFDLLAAGVDTWSELQDLRVMLLNNGTIGVVQIDYAWLEVKFAESRWMEWQYEVPNEKTQISHLLNISAYTTGETFNVLYSLDNNIWYDAFSFSETTETFKELNLPHTTNSKYYLKIVAADVSLTDANNDSLYVDLVSIRHSRPTVQWEDSEKSTVSFPMQSGSEFITALAVGDVTSSSNKPDSYPDIIIGTSYVGSGSSERTLMVSSSLSGGSFAAPVHITTSGLSAAVGSNNLIYNVQTIALGDFNGDGYTDIALIIGFAPGRSGGTAPSIWLYRNDPTVGQWGEQVLNALASGESAINVQAGNVDLTILYPLLGILGLVAVEGWISRTDRKRR